MCYQLCDLKVKNQLVTGLGLGDPVHTNRNTGDENILEVPQLLLFNWKRKPQCVWGNYNNTCFLILIFKEFLFKLYCYICLQMILVRFAVKREMSL